MPPKFQRMVTQARSSEGDTYRDRTLRDMTKITARRILLLFGVLAAIFIAFGLATAGRDPIQRTYGEAGRELETAMDRLSDVAIGCSTEIVAAVEMGGASVGCTTPQAIRVALVAFRNGGHGIGRRRSLAGRLADQ